VGPRAGLDRCGKSCPHKDSIPGPSSPYPVSIPIMLPGPHFVEYAEINRPLASVLEGEETPENTERDTDGPEPTAEGDIQMD